MKKKWYDYLWIFSLTYLILGFFNILFAWLGLLCFFIPLIISIAKGTKGYCNRYCGRGQLFSLLGGRFGLSRKRDVPKWMKSKAIRYGFHIFFFVIFFIMLWNTYLVFAGATELNPPVDLPAPLALGLSRDPVASRRCPVRLRLLQRHAHLHGAGACDHGAFQAQKLVRLLPHGHHDPAHLQNQKQGKL